MNWAVFSAKPRYRTFSLFGVANLVIAKRSLLALHAEVCLERVEHKRKQRGGREFAL